jgi:hypothetical protein
MKLPVVEPHHLLTLSSFDDDGLGEESQIVWEIEPGVKVAERVVLPLPSGFDAPAKLDDFLDVICWGAASTADVKSIQSPLPPRYASVLASPPDTSSIGIVERLRREKVERNRSWV